MVPDAWAGTIYTQIDLSQYYWGQGTPYFILPADSAIQHDLLPLIYMWSLADENLFLN